MFNYFKGKSKSISFKVRLYFQVGVTNLAVNKAKTNLKEMKGKIP